MAEVQSKRIYSELNNNKYVKDRFFPSFQISLMRNVIILFSTFKNFLFFSEESVPAKRSLASSSATRAQIPQPAAFDYDVMPEVRLSSPHRGKRADDPYKHLKQTMARMRRGEKKRKI